MLSIFEAVMARVKVEFPTVLDAWLVKDNARNYQNYLVPVVAPFIAKSHGTN